MTTPICKCGCDRPIIQGQWGAEGDEAFAERLATGYARRKCARLHNPLPSSKGRTLQAPVSWNRERPDMTEQPKEKIPRSEPYLKFIKAQECILAGGKFGPCVGDVTAHHTGSGGMGIKGSDLSTVPVCAAHHLLMDNAGKKGRGIWTRQERETIITRLNEEFNFQQSHKRRHK
jgi:hypothetical protein